MASQGGKKEKGRVKRDHQSDGKVHGTLRRFMAVVFSSAALSSGMTGRTRRG